MMKRVDENGLKIPKFINSSGKICFLLEYWSSDRQIYRFNIDESCIFSFYSYLAKKLKINAEDISLTLQTKSKCVFITPFGIAAINPSMSLGKILKDYGPQIVLVLSIQPLLAQSLDCMFEVEIEPFQSEYNRIFDRVFVPSPKSERKKLPLPTVIAPLDKKQKNQIIE
jgi:hypothetical protein